MLIEFTYNNYFQASIRMVSYNAVCGRNCMTHLCWEEIRERKAIGAKIVDEAIDKIRLIRVDWRLYKIDKYYFDIKHRPR